MKFLRSMIMGVLLIVPMLSSATTTTSFSITSVSLEPGQQAGVIQDVSKGPFSDTWSLEVGAGEKASINFVPLNLSVPLNSKNFDIFKINNFTITPGDASYSTNDLSEGFYTFTVTGSTEADLGYYSVGTAVSAVPVPATVWMLGTALVGLVSFTRRKNSLTY